MPVGLAERCIKAGTRPGDIVLDPFSGNGTTGVAALNLGRRFVGIELIKKFAESSRERLDALVHLGPGKENAEVRS